MEEIQTAGQFLSDNINRVAFPWIDDLLEDKDSKAEAMKKCMIEFAKLHVKAALEAAAKNARMRVDVKGDGYTGTEIVSETHLSAFSHADKKCSIQKESILSAYPEDNIK